MKNTILVICHDTGGAEIISAHIKSKKNQYRFICFVSGPAIRVFQRKKIQVSIIRPTADVGRILKRYCQTQPMVLTGVSWSTDLEIRAILAAKKMGLPTAAYIDHWVNYRERFGFPGSGWLNNLPEQIWVGDTRAYHLAKRCFSASVLIRYVKNQHFEEIKQKYRELEKRKHPSGLLIVAEPLSEAINSRGQKLPISVDEFEWLEIVLSDLAQNNFRQKVTLRLHPSEARDKYDAILKKYSGKIKLRKSRNQDIIKDLVAVDSVIGLTSMALVTAVICHKAVFSLILDQFLMSFVPQYPGIRKLYGKRTMQDKLKFFRRRR